MSISHSEEGGQTPAIGTPSDSLLYHSLHEIRTDEDGTD
jgi:hypothetical protein